MSWTSTVLREVQRSRAQHEFAHALRPLKPVVPYRDHRADMHLSPVQEDAAIRLLGRRPQD